ncbi:MAG: DEAD/DEAH box helicase [Planctomycetaceae bacterium]
MSDGLPSRDDLASRYLDQLPYEPYPVQEEALLAWFSSPEGVLVCAPTGMGKTLIAEAALFEALHSQQIAYYTTPLIALTEQKFREMQRAAVRWGFDADDVGLVTGNRRVNPDARILVVVAEILLNRLLHPEAFDFSNVASVVMDEFHSFNDPERGVVWELSLGLLPKHVRLLLLSATVGNSSEFMGWLRSEHQRKVQLVQSDERRVPLRFEWVGEKLLDEQLEAMAEGDDEAKRTPALVFCFNREECWSVAETLKGKALVGDEQRKKVLAEIEKHDFTHGAGPKLKQILTRGVGVHHAGMLPRYRRIVEELFQRKLLSVAVCTETLAAGINLPARSVVLTTLLKGPPGKKRLVEPSSAHQMFGRAGRPQFDREGFVFALGHEDDVKIERWKRKHDTIPEDTKDPNLIKARKRILKKMPTRRKNEQYWSEEQFEKLRLAPPGKLASRGQLPWRLLAYLLKISPEVDRLREFVDKRLLDSAGRIREHKRLISMLRTLWAGGYVTLDPEPPPLDEASGGRQPPGGSHDGPPHDSPGDSRHRPADAGRSPADGTLGALLSAAREESKSRDRQGAGARDAADDSPAPAEYEPRLAHPTPELDRLLEFRSVNPLYGDFLLKRFEIADTAERIQLLESVLEVPGSVARHVRVPPPDFMPPGPLATTVIDQELIRRGLATHDELYPKWEEERLQPAEVRKYPPPLGDKAQMLFDSDFPNVHSLETRAVWIAGDLLEFNGDFHKYISGRQLAKQEGIVFRHLLRLILLCGEFEQVGQAFQPAASENVGQAFPPGRNELARTDAADKDVCPTEWRLELREIAERLVESCRAIDPESTDKTIEAAQARPDVVAGETAATEQATLDKIDADLDEFGSGLV